MNDITSQENLRKYTKLYTLVLVRKGAEILLGLKKRGFGTGKWNGFGGKVEPGEMIEEAARRELLEECHITVPEMTKVGILRFEFQGTPKIMEVHVFTAEQFSGTPTETEEMKPQWFSIQDIPYADMWLDDQYWWPLFLKNEKFTGYFMYKGNDTILSYQLSVTDQVL